MQSKENLLLNLFENVLLYNAETWRLNRKIQKTIVAVEVDTMVVS